MEIGAVDMPPKDKLFLRIFDMCMVAMLAITFAGIEYTLIALVYMPILLKIGFCLIVGLGFIMLIAIFLYMFFDVNS